MFHSHMVLITILVLVLCVIKESEIWKGRFNWTSVYEPIMNKSYSYVTSCLQENSTKANYHNTCTLHLAMFCPYFSSRESVSLLILSLWNGQMLFNILFKTSWSFIHFSFYSYNRIILKTTIRLCLFVSVRLFDQICYWTLLANF